MTQEAKLQIVIDAVNSASRELKKLQDDLGGVNEKTKQSESSVSKLSKGFEDLTGVSVPTALTLSGVGAAAGALLSIVSDSVGRFGEYAEQVRGLSFAYSLTSEEASELIQVLGDARVAPASLETAFRSLADKGIQPTVENLADLADEFVNIHNPVEKAEYLADKFGMRAGPEMAKALGLGGNALRQYAQDARDAGLLLTEADMAASERLKMAQDRLGDAQIQFDRTVGLAGTQIWAEVLDATGDAWNQLGEWYDLFNPKVMTHYEWVQETARAYRDLTHEAEREANRLVLLSGNAMAAVEDQAVAVDKLGTKYGDLQTILDGRLGQAVEDYQERQGKAAEKVMETRDRIAELEDLEYLTDDQKTELDDLKQSLDDQILAMQRTREEHGKMTAGIVLDLIQQRLAQDGWQDGELETLATLGKHWGLYDDTTADVLATIDRTIQEHGVNAQAIINAVGSAILGLPSEKIIKLTVQTNSVSVGDENYGGWTPPTTGDGGAPYTPPPSTSLPAPGVDLEPGVRQQSAAPGGSTSISVSVSTAASDPVEIAQVVAQTLARQARQQQQAGSW